MVFKVIINQTAEYQVDTTTAKEAIDSALNQYFTDVSNKPDTCLYNTDTAPLCLCVQPVGDLTPVTP